MRELIPATFAELAIPFACVSCDLVTGEPVVISEGDLPRAVRASMTVPIMFDPVRDGERLLVDGAIVDPVPVAVARALGGDPVVAVDVGMLTPVEAADHGTRGLRLVMESGASPTAVQVGTRSLDVMVHGLSAPSCASAAVVINPDVGGYSFTELLEGPPIIAEGTRAARAALTAIREAIAEAARAPVQRWWRRLIRS